MKNILYKVIQLTDTHLFGDSQNTMFGINCNNKFLEVINQIKKQETEIDFFLATGDISQDKSEASYECFMETGIRFEKPVYWLDGNHDDFLSMQKVFSKSPFFANPKILSKPYWDFIFVNTSMANKDSGFIAPTELEWLKHALDASRNADKLVSLVMHHHPFSVSTSLIDKYKIKNGDQLLELLVTYKNIRNIICGHVHNNYTIPYQHIMLEASPATCVQWKKGSETLIVDERIGYKIYQFYETCYTAEGVLW